MANRDRQFAEAMNDLQSANLGNQEDQLLRSFVTEYFVSRDSDDNDVSEDPDSSSDEEGILSDESDGDYMAEEEPDQPLLNVELVHNDNQEPDDDDDDHHRKASAFRCHCNFHDGGACSSRFSVEDFVNTRYEMSELTKAEKDMFILGQIRCVSNDDRLTASSKHKIQTERRFRRSSYLYHGMQICRETFLFLHDMSINKLTALSKHYKENGCIARKHKNRGNVFVNHLTFDDRVRAHTFIKNYAEVNAILLPGRIPGYARDDIKLLPSHETKANVWRKYKAAMEDSDFRSIGKSTFRKLWNVISPFIICCKPMSDVCWVCQRNNSLLYKSANLSDAEKSDRCRAQQDHLEKVAMERDLYRQQSVTAKATTEQHGIVGLGRNDPCSRNIEMHYSFDFAQQVHYPSDPFQPGPVYFLTGRKCGIFGVHCEGTTKQVNYLVDEAVSISKGSSAVISYIHHFFASYGLGETKVHLHCDNCSGQNKNRMMMWYILWRCMHGLHSAVELHFMVVGHTKFAPDWCFGLLKQRYRKTAVSSLAEMVDVVRDSTPSGINIPQLVGDEAGTIHVNQYDWQEFLSPFFKPFNGIKSLQHFRFSSDEPGVVYARKTLRDPEIPYQLLKSVNNLPPADLPDQQLPPGLDAKRQWYLYEKIREYCSTNTRDTVCPLPEMPKP